MNCPRCKSKKTYRKHAENLDYLWLYACLDCGRGWLKSKYDAPGIAYAVSVKREKIKGHYRTVVRNQFGQIITSKKWSSKRGGEKMGKKIVKQDSVNYTLRKGRRVIVKKEKRRSVEFPNGEPEYWYGEYDVEANRVVVRLGDFIAKFPKEMVMSWFDIQKKETKKDG